MQKLFGVTPDVGRQMDRAQLYFAGGWPVRVVALVLVVGAAWFGYCYIRDGKTPPLYVKIPLLLMRLVALAAILAMLLQPMLRIQHSDRQRSSVVILADTSQSMGFVDRRLPSDRAARAQRASGLVPTASSRAQILETAANRAGLLGDLSKRYSVRAYTFDGDAQPVKLPEGKDARMPPLRIEPDSGKGVSTQIGSALKRAMDDTAGQRVAGVLVLSRSISATAAVWFTSGTPVRKTVTRSERGNTEGARTPAPPKRSSRRAGNVG